MERKKEWSEFLDCLLKTGDKPAIQRKLKGKKGFRMKDSIEVEEGETSKFATIEKSSKRRRKKRRVKKDRLSNLPDEIIHRVLSFLDAKSGVQTSVLSKRWRYLWTSLPVLNFNIFFFNDPLLFQCFVDHVLSCRDASSNVHELNFECPHQLDDGHIVDSIIDYVTLTLPTFTSIRVLSIYAECVVGKLPQLSLCQSLTTLKLAHISAEITTFDFVSLKQLYLFDCWFECGEDEFLDPFRGCVNLRCLILRDCEWYSKIKRFKIFAPQLTDLEISWMEADVVFGFDRVIELFTPKLQSFTYCDCDLYDFSVKVNLPFVEKVKLDVGCFTEDTNLLLKLIQLFEVIGSVKFVSLSSGIIEVLSMYPDLLDGRASPFTKVQTFELPSSFVIPPNVMAYLFGGPP